MFSGIDHYVLFVQDLAASKAWYQAFGLPYSHGGPHGHFFQLPAGGLLMLHPSDTGPQGSAPQLYLTTADVHGALAKLQAAGADCFSPNGPGPLPVTTPWGSTEFCVRDPDGHIWGVVQARS